MAWKFFDSAGNLLGLGQPGADGANGADGTTMPDGTNPGDILVWDGDSWEILAVGADDDVLIADSGEALGLKWGPGGGGGSTAWRYPVQEKAATGGTSTNSLAATLGATPTAGNVLVLCSAAESSQNISSITQTNVSWSKLAETPASTAPHAEIWVGVVSASAGTTITVNYSATNYCGWAVQEWADLAGTLDQSDVASSATSRIAIPLITPTDATALVVSMTAPSTYAADLTILGAVGLIAAFFRAGSTTNYGVLWGFPGATPTPGYISNGHGGTLRSVTVSIV